MLEPKLYQNAIAGIGDLAERRAQIEQLNLQRAAEREQQLALQSSPLSGPEERIRQWEKLHALNLPRSSQHKLLRVIAEQTNLSIQDVLDAQQRRAAPVVTSVTAPIAAPVADQPAMPVALPAAAS